MKIAEKSFLSETSLFYLFTLGGSLFTFGKCGIFCLLTATSAGLLTLFIFSKIKRLNRFFALLLAAFCVFTGIYTFYKFVIFIKQKQLFYTPVIFIALVFGGVAVYFCRANKKALLKFSVFGFAVSVIFFAILFFATVKNADFKDIPYALDFKPTETLKVYFVLFLPTVIPVAFIKPKFKSMASGVIITAFTLLIFITLTYCTFGAMNEKLNSPILALVDTANVGRVFTRLDAFLLAIIYLSCLVRSAVSFKTAIDLLRFTPKSAA